MLLHRERGLGCTLRLSMEIQPHGCCFDDCVLRLRLLVASVAGSPAGGRVGVFPDARSGCSLLVHLWCRDRVLVSGSLCWSPVHSTLWQLENLSGFRGYGSGFLPPTSGRSFIGGTSAWSGPLLRVTAVSLAFGLATAVFLGGGGFTHGYGCCLSSSPSGVADSDISVPVMLCASTRIFSGQSWPLLDFPCCGFSTSLCRSCLTSPSRRLSEFALSCHQLVSPRCGCV